MTAEPALELAITMEVCIFLYDGFMNGSGGIFPSEGMYENYWPRAVIIDFYCDSSVGIGSPQYVLEYPSYTYKSKYRRLDNYHVRCEGLSL